jgi:hypothetical protein
MILAMRFQILLLAICLAASMLAGYAVSETPVMSLASSDSFAGASDFGERPAMFAELSNELSQGETAAEICDRFRAAARDGGREPVGGTSLAPGFRRASAAGVEQQAGALARACPAP